MEVYSSVAGKERSARNMVLPWRTERSDPWHDNQEDEAFVERHMVLVEHILPVTKGQEDL